MTLRRLPALLLTTLLAATLYAQEKPATAAGAVPAWDVISVKPVKNAPNFVMINYTPDGLHANGVSLSMLANTAYELRPDLITGAPKWASDNRYDVEARVAPEDVPKLKDLTRQQREQMVLNLLTERFGWKAHDETKEATTYDLVIAKGGPKLEAYKEGAAPNPGLSQMKTPDGKQMRGIMMMPGHISAQDATVAQFAKVLENEVERNVIDKTGLTGKYEFNLTYHSQRQFGGAAPHDNGTVADPDADASIFTALQDQLGLKLQPSKGMVRSIVVDHAELPAEN